MNDASVSTSTYAEHLVSLHLPRYDEIPSIDLYMDQLVGFLEDTLAPLYQPGEKIITRSMVNNYVKQGVLASAAGKKYTRSHIAYLIVICTLKQTFSIAEIDRLIRMQIAGCRLHALHQSEHRRSGRAAQITPSAHFVRKAERMRPARLQ